MNWLIPLLIMGGSSIINALFGGGSTSPTQTTNTTSTTEPRRQQDPRWYLMSQMLMPQIVGRMQQMGGAGMPGGQAYNPMGNQMYGDFWNMMKDQWPQLMAGFSGQGQGQRTNLLGG